MSLSGNQVMSGTHAEVFIEGQKVTEAQSCQAKMSYNKTDIQFCGSMNVDTKIMSQKGTGSISMFRVSSRMISLLKENPNVRFTVIMKLDDPSVKGAERIQLNGCNFDDLTLFDAATGSICTVTCPFTFLDYTVLESINVYTIQ